MDASVIAFYFMALALIFFSVQTLISANPVYSALYLAMTMITLSGTFFMLGAPFIAGVQLIVYAGAVMVLFVMVLMLFDLKTEIRAFSRGPVSGFLKIASVGFLCGFVSLLMVVSGDQLNPEGKLVSALPATSTKDLAVLLFSKYLFAFEILGVLLLVVAIGAVALSRVKGGTHARH